jgi:hypothetical protein
VHVGELITFHPPDNRAETYTHEISRIFANGAIQTRGIADATHDPWLITRSDIVGVADFTVWELGWVLKALPLLAVGVLFWVVARPWIGERARRGWDSGWMTVLTVVPLWMLHPLVGATVIASTMDASQGRHLATDTIVNTGILPISFRATGGQAVHVSSTAVVHVSGVSVNGSLKLHETVSLPWWGLTFVVLSMLSPLAGCLWHIWRDTEAVPDIGAERNPVAPLTRRRRGEFHPLAPPELGGSPITIDPPRRLVAADFEAVAVDEMGLLLVDSDKHRVRRRLGQHAVGQTRDPMLEAVEVRQHDHSLSDGEVLAALAARPGGTRPRPA